MGFWLKTWLKYDFDHKRVPHSQSFPDLVAPRMFYISGVIRPLHISVHICTVCRQRLTHFNSAQNKTKLTKKFWNFENFENYWRVNLWRKTVIFQWFKLGAFIDTIYVRSYNVRNKKIYSAEICAYIEICLICLTTKTSTAKNFCLAVEKW